MLKIVAGLRIWCFGNKKNQNGKVKFTINSGFFVMALFFEGSCWPSAKLGVPLFPQQFQRMGFEPRNVTAADLKQLCRFQLGQRRLSGQAVPQ